MWIQWAGDAFLGLLGLAVLATLFTAGRIMFGPRLVPVLMWRYLLRRRIAWVSLFAVTLCTLMVLVVISVMGGWLRMFRETNHGLIGDIIVYRDSLTGFGHYEEMIAQIQGLTEVNAAAPQIETPALINIGDQIKTGVDVVGVDINQIVKVNKFASGLHLQPAALNKMADAFEKQGRTADAAAAREKAKQFPSFDGLLADSTYKMILGKDPNQSLNLPGMIIGSGVITFPGNVRPPELYHQWVRLTPLVASEDVEPGQASESATKDYWIVDDEKTGVFLADKERVYVPFDVLQKELLMDPQDAIDRVTGEAIKTPARCNSIVISLKPGNDMNLVRPKIETIVDNIWNKYPHSDPSLSIDPLRTETWEQKQADFLNAVEHEKVLLVFLFAIISVVAIFLVFCIFFMIVVEKTRDIGIIKSVGATGGAVTQIFLGYGLIIGILGSGMGLLLGYLIVHNINGLHAWMAHRMGITIWDAKTYLFDTIPNTMQAKDVIIIVTISVLSSVLGAVVPAMRAGRMNPIEALRFE